MKEFSHFHKKTQRYIRQSLDVMFERGDPLAKWGRTDIERGNIRNQMHNYRLVAGRIVTQLARTNGQAGIGNIEGMMGSLIAVSTFDISIGCLPHFGCYRFLYERLFGGDIRPWLPAAYVAASAMPDIPPQQRSNQLRSISGEACTVVQWHRRDPLFIPEWVDKVEPPPPALPAPSTESSAS